MSKFDALALYFLGMAVLYWLWSKFYKGTPRV